MKKASYRILTIINNLRFGGAEVITGQVLDRLDPSVFFSVVCCLGGPDDLRPTFERHGHRVIYLNTRKSGIVINVLKLIQVIKRERIDIVSTSLSPSIIYGPLAAKVMRKPVISAVHNVLSFKSQKSIIFESLFLRLSDRIIAVSEAVKQDVHKYYRLPYNKIELIRNGSNPNRFKSYKQTVEQKEKNKLLIGLGSQSFIIGTVASLTTQKNHSCLIRSFPKIRKNIPEAQLVLVGDGPLRKELENNARELGIKNDVKFVGNQNDVPKFLEAMDVFVLPSLWEGLSISLVEAMLMEKAVVATNVDGIREVVEDGKTGILAESGDSDAIANAVIALYHDKEKMKKMGINGRERALRLFNIDRTAIEYQSVFLGLLKYQGK